MNDNEMKDLKARGDHSVKMRVHFIEQEDKQIRDIITFAIALMSILGVMAGLGFTAFQYVLTPALFFLGEFLILGSIFYIGFKVKRLLVSWASQTSKVINDFAEDSRKIKEAIINGKHEEMKKMSREFRDLVNDTTPGKPLNRAVSIDQILDITFYFALAGIFCIFMSFIVSFC